MIAVLVVILWIAMSLGTAMAVGGATRIRKSQCPIPLPRWSDTIDVC